MRIFLLCLAAFLSLAARAQDTTWYGAVSDNSPQRISSITAKTDSGWRMVNYYITGKISTVSLFADDSCTIPKGDRIYFTPKGRVSRRVHFEDGKASGNDIYYYDNGKVLASGINRDGAPDGEWDAWYQSGKPAAKAFFAGGKQTTAGQPFFQESVYPGGMTALYEYLDKTIQYPASAFVYNVQGVVVLQFRVTKEGTTQDLVVIQPVDPALDKEAYRVVSGMRPWEPARIGGIPVDTFKRLPIQFKQ